MLKSDLTKYASSAIVAVALSACSHGARYALSDSGASSLQSSSSAEPTSGSDSTTGGADAGTNGGASGRITRVGAAGADIDNALAVDRAGSATDVLHRAGNLVTAASSPSSLGDNTALLGPLTPQSASTIVGQVVATTTSTSGQVLGSSTTPATVSATGQMLPSQQATAPGLNATVNTVTAPLTGQVGVTTTGQQ